MVSVEICIDCSNLEAALASASAAHEGGARRVECCASMNDGGLTPDVGVMSELIDSVGGKVDIVAMIRPRAGDFEFSRSERLTMLTQAEAMVALGVDGLAFGSLTNGEPDEPLCEEMILFAKTNGVKTTFHRAFDALQDPLQAISILEDLGIDRILTSGTPWLGNGTCLDGLPTLKSYLQESEHVEWVIAGGVSLQNAPSLLDELAHGTISLHAYSSVLDNGLTSAERVRDLVNLIKKRGER